MIKSEKEQGKVSRPIKSEHYEPLCAIPAFIMVVMPVDPRPTIFEEDFATVSACIQNLQLAAWEHGIGVLWNTDHSIYSTTFHVQVGMKLGEKIVGIMQMGYLDITLNAQPRTSIEERLTVITNTSQLEETK